MKVLLIHNKDITMEYLENILESKCIQGEVIVALPDAFTLEVMRNIHFDMVIGSIHGSSVGVMEDFLGKVKLGENENEIYTYMAVDKETLCTLDQDFLEVVDDFISIPLDREEFGYRLAKAAKRFMKRNGTEALAGQKDAVAEMSMPDVSSPEMKLLDSNLQEVSIKDILESEVIEPDNMDTDSLFLSDENFSAMEAESDDLEPEASIRESGPVLDLLGSDAEQLKEDVLKIEVHPEPDAEAVETGIEEIENKAEEVVTEEVVTEEVEAEVEEVESEVEAVETEAEAIETDLEEIGTETKELGIEAEEIEPEADIMEAEKEEEPEVEIDPEPSYDELLKARELRREKEKAEIERQERLKWEKVEEAARVISKESIPVAGSAAAYGEQVVGASIIVGASSFSSFDSKAEIRSSSVEDADGTDSDSEPSYEELLKAREIKMELEKAEKERLERLRWESLEESVEPDPKEVASAADIEPSYHEQVVRAAISAMPETVSESDEEPEVLQKHSAKGEEIPCEPSYEDLVREREYRMQKEQEEARRQSMAKKFSGFNLTDEADGAAGSSDPVVQLETLQVEHRLNSKAETIKDEIDLLKHLRKDYNVKTSKVNSAKFKKEKKSIAAKRQKKESKSNGLVAKVTKVFVFLLLVVITTLAIFFIKEKLQGGIPVAAGSSIVSALSDLWIRLWR